jgi:hypothetical protein
MAFEKLLHSITKFFVFSTEEDKNVYCLIYRYLIVVDEQQNFKHHLLICHLFNEEVQPEVGVVVVMNKKIILMV